MRLPVAVPFLSYIRIVSWANPLVNVCRGCFRRFGKIPGKKSIAFVQFFLTFILWVGKMDSVWCTLPQEWVSQRFMITGVLPGYAFCASWRFASNCPVGGIPDGFYA